MPKSIFGNSEKALNRILRKECRQMASVKKHRKAKIAKHKRKKRRRLNRHKKRK